MKRRESRHGRWWVAEVAPRGLKPARFNNSPIETVDEAEAKR